MLFTLKNVTKKYAHHSGTIVLAMNDVSLEIEEGEFVVVTGPSGSGKSTLLFTMGVLMRPTSGTIHFQGLALHDADDSVLSEFRKTHIGYVMQNFSLVPYLTAEENVMVAVALTEPDIQQQRERSRALLERVGLSERRFHHPRELSAGQQQRIAIARALANEPSVILADEPTGNLDPSLALDVLEQLHSLNQENGMTIVMVTHSPTASSFGTSLFQMRDGELSERVDAPEWSREPLRAI